VEGFAVLSPSVGLFWRSPRPGAPPFVEVGQVVQKGTVLAIVEVMKLMNHVVADRPGTVVVIHVENATEVEYGQPLMTIAP
jgi:acetyl-CoA carboxylase biotin carboxyl carrier protein